MLFVAMPIVQVVEPNLQPVPEPHRTNIAKLKTKG